jgi:AraC-like DNA-binding protein
VVRRFRLPRIFLTRLEEHGVSLAEVTRAAALPPAWAHDDRPLLDTEQFFAFWRAVGDRDPLIGLRLGGEDRTEHYDPVTLAALSSATFRDAVERAGRYKELTCPEEIRLTGRGREQRVQFRFPMARDVVPSVLQDFCFSWLVALGRLGTGHPLAPLRVELSRTARYRKEYEAHFRCPVRFNADADALVFASADLDRSFRTQNRELLAMLAPQLDAELARQRGTLELTDSAKGTVKRLLAGRRPELADVARELGVSTRTLQRRLTEKTLTFQQILEDARRELARHYLLQSTLDLTETAYLLGYEDANSFFRAFHQWEGESPRRWRERQRADAPPARRASMTRSLQTSSKPAPALLAKGRRVSAR